jgi:hypothetical protein
MNVRRYIRETLERIRADRVEGIVESAYQFYFGLWVNSTALYDPGDPIWDREWDLLIVLDACRPELLTKVATEYDFVTSCRTVWSNASSSGEWLEKNCSRNHVAALNETAYVTGNPHSATDLPARDAFEVLDEVWKYAWDDDLGTLPPRPVTDRAITVGRESAPDSMIIHYMQPHFPAIPRPELGSEMGLTNDGTREHWDSIWYDLRHGTVELEEVWAAYEANLRYVLDDVAILLNNVDADRAVITADHGNAIGEYAIYGHPTGTPIGPLRRVPWLVTSATDEGRHEPADWKRADATSALVEERLRDLGYR